VAAFDSRVHGIAKRKQIGTLQRQDLRLITRPLSNSIFRKASTNGSCAGASSGGIIAARMLLKQPERFGRVFALDPVTPLGMPFNAEQIGLFRSMMASREVTRAVMATAAASLFVPESLAPNMMPRFREGLGDVKAFYERILEQTFGVSEGVCLGTPFNLNLEWENRELEQLMPEIRHPHLVLWGEKDGWIAPEDLRAMASAMPDCRLVTVPGIGHSMNVERPALYAGYFGAWFGGLTGRE